VFNKRGADLPACSSDDSAAGGVYLEEVTRTLPKIAIFLWSVLVFLLALNAVALIFFLPDWAFTRDDFPANLLFSQVYLLALTVFVLTWGWPRVRQVRARSGLLVLTVLLALLTFFILLPGRILVTDFAGSTFASVQTGRIAGVCQVYTNDHDGRFPDSLLDLLQMKGPGSPDSAAGMVRPSDLVFRATKNHAAAVAGVKAATRSDLNFWSDFIYVGAGLTAADAQKYSGLVVVYSKPRGLWHTRMVGFADGNRDAVSELELGALLRRSEHIRATLSAPATHPAASARGAGAVAR
jgi:hypothetical protein